MTNQTETTKESQIISQANSAAIIPGHYHDYLGDIGSYASIIGLVISISVLISLRRIKSKFLFQARYPALKKQIAGHSSKISEHLSSNAISDLEIELKRCESNLRSLRPKLGGALKKSVQRLVVDINDLPRPLVDEHKPAVRAIYLGLVQLDMDLKNFAEDHKWDTDK